MLSRNDPDRIQVAFDDHRLVSNAGLLLPVTLAHHLGLGELVDHHVDLGDAPGRANAGDKLLTLVASALAGGDCIDDADALRAGRTERALGCKVKAPSTLGTFLRSFRWGHIRQLDRVSREDAGPSLVCWGRTRLWTVDHRPGLHRLRDLWAGQGGCAAPQLRRPAGLSPAVGRGRRNRRRADGTAAPGPSQHGAGRRPLPAGDGGAGALRRSHRTAHRAGRPRLLHPRHRRRLPREARPLLHHRPPAPPTTQHHRGHTQDGVDAHPILDGGGRRRGRDHVCTLREQARRRTGAAHRPPGETHARLPTCPLRHLQLSRLHHRSRTATPCTWRPTIAATPRSRTPSATPHQVRGRL